MSLRTSEVKSSNYVGKEVMVRGWVYRLRKQKENAFVLVRDDRGGVMQCVFPVEKAASLTIESSIEVTGIVSQDARAPEGGYEIKGKNLKIYNIAGTDYPIGEYQSEELLLDKRHLAMRMRKMIAIAKIRATVLEYARRWFVENGWMEVTAPVIVKGSVEGGSTLFNLKYFEDDAFLSQSAQLYLEAMIFSLGPVWSITPSFRAEKSRTVRHLTEFLHLEAEAPWISLDDLLKIQEELITFVIKHIVQNNKVELEFLKRDISELEKTSSPFDRITYEKAIDILRNREFKIVDKEILRNIEYGDDLSIESERILTENSSKPLFVIGYPLKIKPFYVKADASKDGVGLAADLLAPNGFGEISSGGLREDNLDNLEKRMMLEGLEKRNY